MLSLMNPQDEISAETVKMFILPHYPAVQALLDEREQRVANGEDMAIYLIGDSLWLGPRSH